MTEMSVTRQALYETVALSCKYFCLEKQQVFHILSVCF